MLIVAFLLHIASAHVYLNESFTSRALEGWVYGQHKTPFRLSSGVFNADPIINQGLQTTQDLSFYSISKEFEPFNTANKTLVVQFGVKHEQNLDCGGGYIKVH